MPNYALLVTALAATALATEYVHDFTCGVMNEDTGIISGCDASESLLDRTEIYGSCGEGE